MAGKAYVISICVFRSRNSYNIEKYYFKVVPEIITSAENISRKSIICLLTGNDGFCNDILQ